MRSVASPPAVPSGISTSYQRSSTACSAASSAAESWRCAARRAGQARVQLAGESRFPVVGRTRERALQDVASLLEVRARRVDLAALPFVRAASIEQARERQAACRVQRRALLLAPRTVDEHVPLERALHLAGRHAEDLARAEQDVAAAFPAFASRPRGRADPPPVLDGDLDALLDAR